MSKDLGNTGDRGQESWGKGQGRTQEGGKLAQDEVSRIHKQTANEEQQDGVQQQQRQQNTEETETGQDNKGMEDESASASS
jgi:transcription initiation factor TFIID subunit TAF12